MIRIDSLEVTTFRAQLQRVPPELRKGLSRQIRTATGRFVGQLRSAYSWSSRIPSAVKTRVGYGGGRTGGVLVFIDRNRAPHARPLALPNNGLFNRHPVWGSDTWVNQPARDSFFPTIRDSQPDVVRDVQAAVDSAFKFAGRTT